VLLNSALTAIYMAAGLGLGVWLKSLINEKRGSPEYKRRINQRHIRHRQEFTPLHYVANFGSLDAVNILFEIGADLDSVNRSQGQTPLVMSIQAGHIETTALLLRLGARIRRPRRLSLSRTCWKDPLEAVITYHFGKREAAELVFKYSGMSRLPSHPPRSKISYLHLAARKGSVALLKFWLQHRPRDLVLRDKLGDTPLHYAAQCGFNSEVLYILLKAMLAEPKANAYLNLRVVEYALTSTRDVPTLKLIIEHYLRGSTKHKFMWALDCLLRNDFWL